jgi:hypothetical protein
VLLLLRGEFMRGFASFVQAAVAGIGFTAANQSSEDGLAGL